jgi:hypothetical protein
LIIIIFIEGYLSIADTYNLFINKYPYEKCVDFKRMRYFLFPFSKRNTSKGIPLVILVVCVLEYMVFICAIVKCVINNNIYHVRWGLLSFIFFIMTALLSISAGLVVNLDIFFYNYKRINKKNLNIFYWRVLILQERLL